MTERTLQSGGLENGLNISDEEGYLRMVFNTDVNAIRELFDSLESEEIKGVVTEWLDQFGIWGETETLSGRSREPWEALKTMIKVHENPGNQQDIAKLCRAILRFDDVWHTVVSTEKTPHGSVIVMQRPHAGRSAITGEYEEEGGITPTPPPAETTAIDPAELSSANQLVEQMGARLAAASK